MHATAYGTLAVATDTETRYRLVWLGPCRPFGCQQQRLKLLARAAQHEHFAELESALEAYALEQGSPPAEAAPAEAAAGGAVTWEFADEGWSPYDASVNATLEAVYQAYAQGHGPARHQLSQMGQRTCSRMLNTRGVSFFNDFFKIQIIHVF